LACRFISDRIQADTLANNVPDKQATAPTGSYLTADQTTKPISNTATNQASTALNTASNTALNTTNTATKKSSQLPPVPPPSYENQPPIPAEISFNKRSPPKILFDRASVFDRSSGKREHQLSVASSSGFNPTISLHMMDSTPDSPRGAIRSAYTPADSLLASATTNSPNETDGSRGDQSIIDLYQKNLNNPNVNTNNNKKSWR